MFTFIELEKSWDFFLEYTFDYVNTIMNIIAYLLLVFNPILKEQSITRLSILRLIFANNIMYFLYLIYIEKYLSNSIQFQIINPILFSPLITIKQTQKFVDYFIIFAGIIIIPLSFLLEYFYTWECLQTLRNPISRFSIRRKIYTVITIIILIFICVFYFITKGYQIEIDFASNILFDGFIARIILIISYAVLCVYSIIEVIFHLKVRGKESKWFTIRYLVYEAAFIIYIILLATYKRLFGNVVLDALKIFMSWLRIFECPFTEAKETKISEEYKQNFRQTTKKIVAHQYKNKKMPLLNDSELNEDLNISESPSFAPLIDNAIDLMLTQEEATIKEFIKNQFLIKCIYYSIKSICYLLENEVKKEKTNLDETIHLSTQPDLTHYNVYLIQLKEGDLFDKIEQVNDSKVIKSLIYWNFFNTKIEFIEYAPGVFNELRQICEVNVEEIIESLSILKNLESLSAISESEGKSGSVFFFSYNHKFILKTIKEKEKNTLLKSFLHEYMDLFTSNNSSLIAGVYGLYTIKFGTSHINLILMENIIPLPPKQILHKFDLKGSSVGRKTKNIFSNKEKTLKDQDFVALSNQEGEGMGVKLNRVQMKNITDMLRDDIQMLTRAYVMDYSFFLGIVKNSDDLVLDPELDGKRYFKSRDNKFVYFMGIIDYLTNYDGMKNLETILLNILYKKDNASAVDPVKYSRRMAEFLHRTVFGNPHSAHENEKKDYNLTS